MKNEITSKNGGYFPPPSNVTEGITNGKEYCLVL